MTQQKTGNWGRWGAEDERGALNLLTPDVVKAASGAIKTGKVYSLSLPIQREGIPLVGYRSAPLRLTMLNTSDKAMFEAYGAKGTGANEDYYAMPSHTATHMDALCHVYHDDTIYNGFPADSAKTHTGAERCGIEKARHIVGRAVLLDMAAYLRVERVEPPRIFTGADLLGCADSQGVEIRSGDILLIRTGWLQTFFEDPERWNQGQPGIGKDACKLIAERDIAAVGADNIAVEAIPFDDNEFLAVHILLLRNLGVPLLELLTLDEMAADKAYESLLVVAPLMVTGGMGSPINPIAIG
ncbi:MAG: cyclase family protein [Chloroflexi bacterium]|nr:cyclase family protein [Chloroflexota bacterium]